MDLEVPRSSRGGGTIEIPQFRNPSVPKSFGSKRPRGGIQPGLAQSLQQSGLLRFDDSDAIERPGGVGGDGGEIAGQGRAASFHVQSKSFSAVQMAIRGMTPIAETSTSRPCNRSAAWLNWPRAACRRNRGDGAWRRH